ncbi:hypothetical protein vseg_006949 [Gypsophila vaccaria]
MNVDISVGTGCLPSYRIYCKRQGPGGNYCVAVRNGKLVLTLPNICDSSQVWRKEDSCNRSFMLVHRDTNKVVKFCGKGDQLYLVNKPNCVDKSVLWSESAQNYGGYRFFEIPALLGFVMDAWTGIIKDGTKLSIFTTSDKCSPAENQLWKFIPA